MEITQWSSFIVMLRAVWNEYKITLIEESSKPFPPQTIHSLRLPSLQKKKKYLKETKKSNYMI